MPLVDLYRYAEALGIQPADLLPPRSASKPRPKAKSPKRGPTVKKND